MIKKLSQQKCVECEVGGIPMTKEESEKKLKELKGWRLENNSIKKDFKFKDFVESMSFINKVADIANVQGHHPDIFVSYNKVNITLTTHAVKGLSLNDFIIAAKIDEIK